MPIDIAIRTIRGPCQDRKRHLSLQSFKFRTERRPHKNLLDPRRTGYAVQPDGVTDPGKTRTMKTKESLQNTKPLILQCVNHIVAAQWRHKTRENNDGDEEET
jgi:hypothetical protein